MTYNQNQADIYIPDQCEPISGFSRITHLGIMSHQDDLEVGAYHGIIECFMKKDRSFGGVVVTNGASSPRKGPYAHFTDTQMREVRRHEQRKAAFVGEYGMLVQLGYSSEEVKRTRREEVASDLTSILQRTRPEVVYLHNPADKHDTHVATFLRCLEALRALPAADRPQKVYGCEVWRKLDWLLREDKEMLRVDEHPHLLGALISVFDSQISGGKRYDLAEEGLRRANATYFDPHTTDHAEAITYAMDLTPLIQDDTLDPEAFTLGYVDRLRADVRDRLRQYA